MRRLNLTLEYPLTRSFGSRLLAPLAYGLALVSIVFLIVINLALTGYETVTVFQSDFNATQSMWYDKFLPYKIQKPGTLCEPHLFNAGESIITNSGLFEWKLEAVVHANAGKSGFSYNGTTLDNCDVSEILFSGDLRTWSGQFVAIILCAVEGEVSVIASTTMRLSALAGNGTPMLGLLRSLYTDPTASVIFNLLVLAGNDLGKRSWDAFLASNRTGAVMVSFDILVDRCTASWGPAAACATMPPQFNYTATSSVLSDDDILQNYSGMPAGAQPLILDDVLQGPVSNLAQLIWAAVRVDLGNPSPNNFLLNPDVMLNQTLIPIFPATPVVDASPSTLYAAWANPSTSPDLPGYVPVKVDGPASLQVVYLCRFQSQKGIGSLVVSVLVATLSMFSTGWAVFLLVAAYFAKRDLNAANYCEGCRQDLNADGNQGFVMNEAKQYHLVSPPPIHGDDSNLSSQLDFSNKDIS